MPLVLAVWFLGRCRLFCLTIIYYKTSATESQNEFRWDREQDRVEKEAGSRQA